MVKNKSPSIAAMIMTALQREEKTLNAHRNKFG
jgi:hypothetical protein